MRSFPARRTEGIREAGKHVNLHFEDTQFEFQLLKVNLRLRTTQEVAEQVRRCTEGVFNIGKSETYAPIKCD